MNTVLDQNPSAYSAGASKPLWAAVGALSVAVIALAASLVYVKTRPAEPLTAMVPEVPIVWKVSMIPSTVPSKPI